MTRGKRVGGSYNWRKAKKGNVLMNIFKQNASQSKTITVPLKITVLALRVIHILIPLWGFSHSIVSEVSTFVI